MLPLNLLLPLRSLAVTLRFTGDSRPEFFHQPAMGAFLRCLAGSPPEFERYIRFDTPESGRVRYQSGDGYRFQLIALAGGEAILAALLAGLAGLPGSSPHSATPMPFRDNLELIALHDGFSGEAVQGLAELSLYGAAELEAEAGYWREQPRLIWQSLSPARLLKHKAARGTAKGEARYCRNLADLDGALLLSRLYDTQAELLRGRDNAPQPRPQPPALDILQGHLFWLDAAYTDAAGRQHAMGGAAGRLELAPPQPLPLEWAKLLALGQYTGIGQRGAFGWGRYQLAASDGSLRYRRCPPAASRLLSAQDPQNLAEAYHRHIQANTRRPAPAGPSGKDRRQ